MRQPAVLLACLSLPALYAAYEPSPRLLHKAAEDDDVDLARTAIDGGAELDEPDDDHYTPLHLAMHCGSAVWTEEPPEKQESVSGRRTKKTTIHRRIIAKGGERVTSYMGCRHLIARLLFR